MEQTNISKISRRILCMQLRYWLYLILFFQYLIIVFLFGCMGTRRWVRKGNDQTEWEGGLLSITGSGARWKNEAYDKVRDEICDNNLNPDLCTLFKSLYSAGAAYVFFELLALIFVIVWICYVTYMLFEKPITRWWVGLLWPGLSLLSHIIGISIWAGVTKAGFEINCLNNNSTDICSTNGPALSILTIFLYLGFGTIYAFVLYFRNGVFKKKKEEKEGVEDKV